MERGLLFNYKSNYYLFGIIYSHRLHTFVHTAWSGVRLARTHILERYGLSVDFDDTDWRERGDPTDTREDHQLLISLTPTSNITDIHAS